MTRRRTVTVSAETVEKVPKQLLGWDAEKNDLTESTTINDLIMMRGHGDPRKPPINYTEGFFDSLAMKCVRRAHCFLGRMLNCARDEGWPSESACRSRLQTTLSCSGQEPEW